MYYDKEKYERLIEESPLFSLDKEKEYNSYKRESYRMVELLYCYLMAVNQQIYEPYGCEITEVATRCINNFDCSKGIFIHYFNSAWKQEYAHIKSKVIQEEKYRGLKITEEDKRAVRKYLRFAEQLDEKHTRGELYECLSEAMGMSIDKIRQLAEMSELIISGDSYLGEDGEEHSLWGQVSDGVSFEIEMENAEAVDEILMRIQREFDSLQERQKPIVSDMITIKICAFLEGDVSEKYTFICSDIVKEWQVHGNMPTQRDIAHKYKRDEASISRTVKEFLKKLKREV